MRHQKNSKKFDDEQGSWAEKFAEDAHQPGTEGWDQVGRVASPLLAFTVRNSRKTFMNFKKTAPEETMRTKK